MLLWKMYVPVSQLYLILFLLLNIFDIIIILEALNCN